MKNRNKLLIFSNIALLIGLFFSVKTCSSVYDQERNLEGQVAGLQKQVTSSGDTIYKMSQLIVARNSELAKMVEENEALQKVTAQVKIKEVIEIREIPVPFEKPVFKHCDSSGALFLKLPALYRDTTSKWFQVYGAIDSAGKNRIDILRVYSEPIITFGYAKQKFLKRIFQDPEPIITYTNKNPFIRVDKMSNIIIDDTKKRRVGIGLQAGYGILLPNFKPGVYIGAGIDYRIISF